MDQKQTYYRQTLTCLIQFTVLSGLFLTLLGGMSEVHARWATLDDADSEIEFENVEIDVLKSGAYTQTVELQAKILKESARETLTTRRLHYNSTSTRFKVLAAKWKRDSGGSQEHRGQAAGQ
jgi:hypothetical protein